MVLAGPPEFVSEGNKLYKKAKKIDYYENDQAKMEKIYQSWVSLKKKHNIS